MIENQPARISRSKLYDEVWEIAVTGVSKKYDVPYSKLLNICKKYQIPVPYSGYWTKIDFGKPVEKTPLPPADDFEIDLVNDYLSGRKVSAKPSKNQITDNSTNEPERHNVSSNSSEQENSVSDTDDSEPDIPYKRVYGVYNTYQRETLYEEIWSKPIVDVAEQYGVSDVTILKICKSLEVPVPSRGHWARVRAGEKISKPSLKPTKGKTEFVGMRTYEGKKSVRRSVKIERLAFLTDEEKQAVLDAAENIKLTDVERPLHKKIISYKSKIKQWNKEDRKPSTSQRSPRSYSNIPPFLAGVISEETLPRVLRIVDTLIRQIEKLGGSVNDDLSFVIRNEKVTFSIHEDQDQVQHQLTKGETRDLQSYENDVKRYSWARKPQIRKYDYIFSGRLIVEIREGKYFRDSESSKLELRLGEMLVDLYEKSEVVRLDRIKLEEAERKRQEEKLLYERRRIEYNLEVERTIELENMSLDYQIACKIRDYVSALESQLSPDERDDETTAWIEWALNKADWYDPTIARDDDHFGRREHKKDADRKVLRKIGGFW